MIYTIIDCRTVCANRRGIIYILYIFHTLRTKIVAVYVIRIMCGLSPR